MNLTQVGAARTVRFSSRYDLNHFKSLLTKAKPATTPRDQLKQGDYIRFPKEANGDIKLMPAFPPMGATTSYIFGADGSVSESTLVIYPGAKPTQRLLLPSGSIPKSLLK